MKIEVSNNWEYLTYKFKGEDIDEKKGGYAVLMNGDVVKYFALKTTESYYDHGKEYFSPCYHLITEIDFNGQKIKMRLDELELRDIINTKDKIRKYKLENLKS